MKLLLATDGSESAEGAAQFLTRLQFSPDDEIIVLHVISEIPYDDDYRLKIMQAMKRVAPKILKASVNVLKKVRAKVGIIEEEGVPDATIMKIAEDSQADIIVMGARGLKGIKSVFLGSVTRSVAINSPRPVLITKPFRKRDRGPIKILFPTDNSESSQATAKLLASLPFPDNTELTVMHVEPPALSDIPERFAIEVNDALKEDIARTLKKKSEESERIVEQARTLLGRKFPRLTVITVQGDPSMEILREAENMKGDLIAVGSRGLRGLKGVLGSVSRRVLGHSLCSVLVGKIREG
ncbi:MAG TPA: universal stress protein [Thermodesulfovibrionales bacterium]|nr:universal stress protein [Thermodesulfovibrionales bacterium]